MAEGVPTNNQRGRRSEPCRLWGGLDKARHIVPTALLVRVQCIRKSLHKAVQGPSTRPIVVSMINGSYCRRRRRLTIFEGKRWQKLKLTCIKSGIIHIWNSISISLKTIKKSPENAILTKLNDSLNIGQTQQKSNLICIMSRSIHIPNFESISQKKGEISPKNLTFAKR